MAEIPGFDELTVPEPVAAAFGRRHEGRGVLVSGGTGTIGAAVARRLADEGAAVWIMGRTVDDVARALGETGAAGGCPCDVTDELSVEDAVASARRRLGSIDAAFVGARVGTDGRDVTTLAVEVFRRALDVNLVGAFLVGRAVARVMTGGAIVFNAAARGLVAEPHQADLAASMAGAVMLAKTMALDLAPRGIAVTAICPGEIRPRSSDAHLDDPLGLAEDLARIPAGRFGDPDEVAGLVSFLMTPEAAYLTGTAIPIDGGRHAT